MTRPVLLTVSGTIPGDLHDSVEQGRRPRPDYVELAKILDADILDHAEAARTSGRLGRALARLGGEHVRLAWACFRRRKRYDIVFTDGEQVGFPYAALCRVAPRTAAHVTIGHRLSAGKKVLVHRLLGLRKRVDRMLVYAEPQRRVAVDTLGYRPEQVVLTSFMVDTEFWRPEHVEAGIRHRPMICAVGQELRDYPTLAEAVRGLDVDLVIAAASPWSKRADSSAGLDLPANVEARGFNLFDLRQLYADASFVVVPLQETDFQAGITSILEAMSMGKAVICSRTSGQLDTIVDQETGLYVPPGDIRALRAAIQRLLADPDAARHLGVAGQLWVREHADIEAYATRLSDVVASLRPTARR
jgi:glycosyltransferase involved in cell wall biosynthesis